MPARLKKKVPSRQLAKQHNVRMGSRSKSSNGGLNAIGPVQGPKSFSTARTVKTYQGRSGPRGTLNPYPHGIAPDKQFPPF